jgi:hypothetical protein
MVAVLAVVAWVAPPRTAVAAEPGLAAWTGSVNLYRDGTFTTQKSWLWCTAAGVQIVRNIAEGDEDHSTAGQRRYFDWMRGRNRYELPESAGVDPAGWTAGLRHFVDDRYRLVSSRTFDEALRSAVERLRRTSLPVALTVSHGGHGWILTGFSATADPAATASFKVTSVRVVGPLFGRQSENGYDMPPNTKLTPAELKRFFTPWHYDPMPMVWDGRYVSIQPVPAKAPAATAAPATAAPTSRPTATASPTATPVATATPLQTAAGTPPAVARVDASVEPAGPSDDAVATQRSSDQVPVLVVVLAGLAAVAALGGLAIRSRLR